MRAVEKLACHNPSTLFRTFSRFRGCFSCFNRLRIVVWGVFDDFYMIWQRFVWWYLSFDLINSEKIQCIFFFCEKWFSWNFVGMKRSVHFAEKIYISLAQYDNGEQFPLSQKNFLAKKIHLKNNGRKSTHNINTKHKGNLISYC